MDDNELDEFRVIVAGSRGFDDYQTLSETCDFFLKKKKNVIIISGNAKGADKLGEQYAKERGLKLEVYPADWEKYGKSAGFIRNEEMGDIANALIAFWDGESHGTKHMIEYAKNKGLKIRVYNYGKEKI
jgi:hypothetical protein